MYLKLFSSAPLMTTFLFLLVTGACWASTAAIMWSSSYLERKSTKERKLVLGILSFWLALLIEFLIFGFLWLLSYLDHVITR